MGLKYTGTFDQLKNKLEALNLIWEENQSGKKVTRYNKGILNWFESTGTIQFQGKPDSAKMFETIVSHILYPDDYDAPAAENDSFLSMEEEFDTTQEEVLEQGLEQQFLYGDFSETELFIGIVSAVGTETKRVVEPLINRLKLFDYEVKEVRVSELLPSLEEGVDNEYFRIKHFINQGDLLRSTAKDNSILAAGAIKKINDLRDADSLKTVYIINSLKHPDEVALLRKVYSNGFFLLGIHSDEKRRNDYLVSEKGLKQIEASELIETDEDEAISHGQRTRDTYHLSDFYINLGKNDDQVKNTIQRYLELLFSNPYSNPTFDEFAMFMAFNSSIRSSDLSRQVGAVITRDEQIVATGANDTPRYGGGQYWAVIDPETGKVLDEPDGKDYKREQDSNKAEQRDIINKIIEAVKAEDVLIEGSDEKFEKVLKDSRISDLTEFGRVVHAEMEALLSCSREGIQTVGTTLYCTTFPCHNCAKHIISSGVERVVYVEPYPKSKALELHSESINLKTQLEDFEDENDCRVIFEPFTGIGARRFLDLFSMNLGAGTKLKRKDKDGNILEWSKDNAGLRVPLLAKSYIEVENAAIAKFDAVVKE